MLPTTAAAANPSPAISDGSATLVLTDYLDYDSADNLNFCSVLLGCVVVVGEGGERRGRG
jgi:hypothetical protein